MILKEISFFKEFACAMGACPNTCCKGWRIVFDEETYRRYLREKGKNGWRLRNSIKKVDEEVYFKASLKSCIFHEKQGTCQLQRVMGEEYMPLICRRYPRFWQHYGVFAEESLLLSCPQAAYLFLENLDCLEYQVSTRTVEYERWGTNDDEAYLYWLCELRESMIRELWDSSRSRAQIVGQLLRVMREIQERVIHGEWQIDITEIMQKHKNSEALHIDAQVTDHMLTSGFYHRRLRTVSPQLYQLCKRYFKAFDHLSAYQANEKWEMLCTQMHTRQKELDRVLRGYLVYYLQMVFLEVYEDYSFVRKLVYGIMHMHILERLLSIYENENKSLSHRELAELISVYERRGRHNEDVADGMYEKLYAALEAYD